MNKTFWKAFWLVVIVFARTLVAAEPPRYELQFPNLPGYQTLACDLHMHTVFSDGGVWPTVRVQEAWRLGLHAIAISDHIEYTPHKEDIPIKPNRPFELAEGQARAHNLLLVRAAEITQDTPPGHFNAIFLKDVKPLHTRDPKDLMEKMKLANEQGAFVFWNHHEWQGAEKGRWLDIHTKLWENKWFQGMEICNGDEYYPQAHAWCLEKNLTMLGASDIHDPDLRKKNTAEDHRTITLVLVKERSLAGLKEGLLEGRTLVWYKNQLIGQEKWLRPFFEACLQVSQPHARVKNTAYVEVKNISSTDIVLEQTTKNRTIPTRLPAGSVTVMPFTCRGSNQPVEKNFTVSNFLVAPQKGLAVSIKVPVP